MKTFSLPRNGHSQNQNKREKITILANRQPPYVNPCLFHPSLVRSSHCRKYPGVNVEFLQILIVGLLGYRRVFLREIPYEKPKKNPPKAPTKWVGIPGALARFEGNVSANFLYPNHEILPALDYSFPLMERKSVLAISKSKHSNNYGGKPDGGKDPSTNWIKLAQIVFVPFHTSLWWLLIAVTAVAILLRVTCRRWIFGRDILTILVMIKLEYFFLSNYYMSSRVVDLTALNQAPFRSYTDFVRKVRKHDAAYVTTDRRKSFVTADIFRRQLFPRLGAALVHNPAQFVGQNRPDVYQHVIRNPDCAAIVSEASFDDYTRQSCALRKLPIPGSSRTFLSIPMQKGSRLASEINQIMYYQGASLADTYRIVRNRYLLPRDCSLMIRKRVNDISAFDMVPNLLVYSGALLLCTLSFLFEMIWPNLADLAKWTVRDKFQNGLKYSSKQGQADSSPHHHVSEHYRHIIPLFRHLYLQ